MKAVKNLAIAGLLTLGSLAFADGPTPPPAKDPVKPITELIWESDMGAEHASINFMISNEFQKALSDARAAAKDNVVVDKMRVYGIKETSTVTRVGLVLQDCKPSGIAPGTCVKLGFITGSVTYQEVGPSYAAEFIPAKTHR